MLSLLCMQTWRTTLETSRPQAQEQPTESLANKKLNTKSSTEAELAAADDSFPLALWTMIFWKKQGHESETTICQDNASAVLSEKNSKESSSKRTGNMNIMCFFIKDCIDKECLTVECCPTNNMTED